MSGDAVMDARVKIGDVWVPLVALVELSRMAPDEPVEVRGPYGPRDEARSPPGVIHANPITGSIVIERHLFDALMAAVALHLDKPQSQEHFQ